LAPLSRYRRGNRNGLLVTYGKLRPESPSVQAKAAQLDELDKLASGAAVLSCAQTRRYFNVLRAEVAARISPGIAAWERVAFG